VAGCVGGTAPPQHNLMAGKGEISSPRQRTVAPSENRNAHSYALCHCLIDNAFEGRAEPSPQKRADWQTTHPPPINELKRRITEKQNSTSEHLWTFLTLYFIDYNM
jgi:hypothetical protein